MPLEIDHAPQSSWNIFSLVAEKLKGRDVLGKYENEDRVYLGTFHQLWKIFFKFSSSASKSDVESIKVFARLACIDNESKKYHIIELYLTERDENNQAIRKLEATWTPKGKVPLNKVVDEIEEWVLWLRKKTGKCVDKSLDITGRLHEYASDSIPARKVK